jgi:hypothetical protein
MDKGTAARRKKSPEHHHALAPEHVRERPGRQLEEDAGDGRGGDYDADEFRQGAEIGGEDRQNWAARHLVAEARKQACQHDRYAGLVASNHD